MSDSPTWRSQAVGPAAGYAQLVELHSVMVGEFLLAAYKDDKGVFGWWADDFGGEWSIGGEGGTTIEEAKAAAVAGFRAWLDEVLAELAQVE